MSTIGSYSNGFAPRDGQPLYPELWRGCVGAWAPCLGPTGLMLRDWSGRGNYGTLTNMVAESDWVASQGRYAVDIDGSNDYVSVQTSGIGATNTVTITAWVLYRTVTANAYAIASRTTGYRGLGISNTFGNITYAWDNSADEYNANTGLVPTVNSWNFIAVQVYPDRAILSLNDQRYTNTKTHIARAMDLTWRIGQDPNPYTPMDGQIDDVRIYNRTLSASEIIILRRRRGIAYEIAPRRKARLAAFRAYWAARKAQIIGGGL